MSDGDLFRIFGALEAAKIRYLVVGGVAVVLHGHPRFTADLDLIVGLEPDNALAAVQCLASLGYRPRAPVAIEDFANPVIRRTWIEDKGLTVFSLWSAMFPATEVDLFVEDPIPFEDAYSRSLQVDLGDTSARVIALSDLLELKRQANRPRDLEDIAALEAIAAEGVSG